MHHRIAGLATLLGVTVPLLLCGLCLVDAFLKTPPELADWAALTFAAFAMSSDIIPLLRTSAMRRITEGRGEKQ